MNEINVTRKCESGMFVWSPTPNLLLFRMKERHTKNKNHKIEPSKAHVQNAYVSCNARAILCKNLVIVNCLRVFFSSFLCVCEADRIFVAATNFSSCFFSNNKFQGSWICLFSRIFPIFYEFPFFSMAILLLVELNLF